MVMMMMMMMMMMMLMMIMMRIITMMACACVDQTFNYKRQKHVKACYQYEGFIMSTLRITAQESLSRLSRSAYSYLSRPRIESKQG